MRDDINYRQRAEETKLVLMNSLTVSDFAKHRSEYNWLNAQKQSLSRGDLPKDRKQFLDKFLPRWDYDTEVLLENMHDLRIKELYNQGYKDLKLFAEVNNIKDAYLLAFIGLRDIKNLMLVPANLLLVEQTNNEFMNVLQKKLRQGIFKPSKMALRLSQAICKTQFGILKHYAPNLKGSDLVEFWLYANVKYTHTLRKKPRRLCLFNFCSPSIYNEKTGQIETLYTPSEVQSLVQPNKSFSNDYFSSAKIMQNLYKMWMKPSEIDYLFDSSVGGGGSGYNGEYAKFLKDWDRHINDYFKISKPKTSHLTGDGENEGVSTSSSSNSGGHSGHSAMEILGFVAAANMLSNHDDDDDGDDGDDGGDD